MLKIPYLKLKIDDYDKKIEKPHKAIKSFLNRLHKEVGDHFDLTADTALFETAVQIFDSEFSTKFSQIKRIGLSAKTLQSRKRGGKARVTSGGGQKEILKGSTEAGVRTGFLMQQLAPPLNKLGGGSLFGYEVRRGMASGQGSMAEFRVRLDYERFYKEYPLQFSEWLVEKTGLGLVELDPSVQMDIVNKMSIQMMMIVESKLIFGD